MCDDYFETHAIDDLMEWENEQVFQDSVLEFQRIDETADQLLWDLIAAVESWNEKHQVSESEMDATVADSELYSNAMAIKEQATWMYGRS